MLLFKILNVVDKKTDFFFHFSKPNLPISNRLAKKSIKIDAKKKSKVVYFDFTVDKKIKLDKNKNKKESDLNSFKKMLKKLKKIKKSLKNKINKSMIKNTFMGKLLISFTADRKLTFINNIPKEIVILMLKKIKNTSDPSLEDCFRSTVLSKEVFEIVDGLQKSKGIEHHFKNIGLTIEINYNNKGLMKEFSFIIDPQILSKLEDNQEFSKNQVSLKTKVPSSNSTD